MPVVKYIIPKSLRDACIDVVVKNIEFWCNQSINDLFAVGPKLGSNPFDQLRELIFIEYFVILF